MKMWKNERIELRHNIMDGCISVLTYLATWAILMIPIAKIIL